MTYNNFIDFAAAEFGIKPKKRKEKPFYCRKCGSEMIHVPGTNVFLCEHKTSDGVLCGNRVFTKKLA